MCVYIYIYIYIIALPAKAPARQLWLPPRCRRRLCDNRNAGGGISGGAAEIAITIILARIAIIAISSYHSCISY